MFRVDFSRRSQKDLGKKFSSEIKNLVKVQVHFNSPFESLKGIWWKVCVCRVKVGVVGYHLTSTQCQVLGHVCSSSGFQVLNPKREPQCVKHLKPTTHVLIKNL